MSDDDKRREAVLTGRAQALKEIMDLANRLSVKVDPLGSGEAALHALLSNWMEMMAFLDQAAHEAEDELILLAAERSLRR